MHACRLLAGLVPCMAPIQSAADPWASDPLQGAASAMFAAAAAVLAAAGTGHAGSTAYPDAADIDVEAAPMATDPVIIMQSALGLMTALAGRGEREGARESERVRAMGHPASRCRSWCLFSAQALSE